MFFGLNSFQKTMEKENLSSINKKYIIWLMLYKHFDLIKLLVIFELQVFITHGFFIIFFSNGAYSKA